MKCHMFVDRLTMGRGRWPMATIQKIEFRPGDGGPLDETVTIFLDDQQLKEFADSIYAYLRKVAQEAQAKAAALVADIPEEAGAELQTAAQRMGSP